MTMKSGRSLTTLLALLAFAAAWSVGACRDETPEPVVSVSRPPKVTPDYVGVVVPPNIAPLNFAIREPGRKYQARIHCAAGEPIEVVSRTGEIVIPPNRWRDLLTRNAGQELYVDVCVKTEAGTWSRYETIVNTIAAEQIDPYLVYRYMTPSSYAGKPLRICQRNLESFAEETVLDAKSFGDGCVHCHSFIGNNPGKILIGMRHISLPSATLYGHEGRVDKIGTKFGYTAWHPSAIVAYSVNDVRQFFHNARTEIHDDRSGFAIFYMTSPSPDQDRGSSRQETAGNHPPDAGWQFCTSAVPLCGGPRRCRPRATGSQIRRMHPLRSRNDVGPSETKRAADTGRSILLPRVSPEGRFLLFCMAEYGCFPIFQPTSDLYLMDLRTGAYRPVPINSDYAEAWHSWSSNSRWIAFSSKREGGVFTRTFLSHVDADGQAGKPFLLPQRRASFYDSCYCVYNMPELVAGPVPADTKTLVRAIVGSTQIHVDSVTGATAKTSGTEMHRTGQASVQ
jgi:hypothetical protein